MPASIKLLVTACTLVLLSACAAPTLKDEPSAEFGAQELYPVRSSGFAEAFVRRDANLPSYQTVDIAALALDKIDISNTAVAGTLRRDWQLTPEREATLQQNWARAMNRAFAGYGRADSGEGVLRITAALTRVAPGRPTATTIGGGIQPAGSSQDVVEISAEFRLYDLSSGRLLAVIRDVRTITSVAMSRTSAAGMTMLFDSWAALLHTRVSGR